MAGLRSVVVRIVAWNCCGGFGPKRAALAAIGCDAAIVAETCRRGVAELRAKNLVGTAILTMLLASCGGPGLEHTIDGVGVGSSCNFDGDFEGVFPCEDLEGSVRSFESVVLVFTNLSQFDGLGLGLGSTKPLRSISSPNAVQFQVDGTLGVVEIDGQAEDGAFRLELEAVDGSTTECRYYVEVGREFECDDWSRP